MKLQNKIASWLKDYAQKAKTNCFVVGVSGGIDSAGTSTLCAMTGIDTHVVNIPIRSKAKNTSLSEMHCHWLKRAFPNVRSNFVDASAAFRAFEEVFDELEIQDSLASANSKSRMRMMVLYHLAAAQNGLVVGTGNKVEDFGVGFYTKYGDGGVDISPIADLTKTEVRQLASDLGINQEILDAPPTDGLWEDSRTDEEQIGASYEELEWAMRHLESGTEQRLSVRQQEVLKIYLGFHTKNKHKMDPIPVFSVSEHQEKT